MMIRHIAFAGVLCCQTALAQTHFDITDTHVKKEYRIPMRDGIHLYTVVYTPRDEVTNAPILLTRTPYSCAPYGEENTPSYVPPNYRRYFSLGYIMVYQDVRGRYMSEGEFENVRPYKPEKKSAADVDESSDAYDTIDWLVKNIPHNNGRVGILGLSYPAFYASMAAIDAHPALKACAPSAPVATWMGGDDFYHNGALLLSHAFNFFSSFGWPRPTPKSEPDRSPGFAGGDEYGFFLSVGPLSNLNRLYLHDSVAFWNTLTTHWAWSDYWAARDVLPHLKNIKTATMFVGGWFDTENLFGALQSYASNEWQSPGADNRIVMGPWGHGQWWESGGSTLGKMEWGSPTAQFYVDSVEVPFFEAHLRGISGPPFPEAIVFNTGRNTWWRLDSWPPKHVREERLYLHDGYRLSFEAPGEPAAAYDEYESDPADPVPYSAAVGRWYSRGFMVEDQRFLEGRADVLSYRSVPLTQEVTIAGPLQVNLVASTSGTDADWIVKVIDVYPGTPTRKQPAGGRSTDMRGYEMLVRGDILRAKFRNNPAAPEAMTPNLPTPMKFDMQDIFHTFKQGHRIMVQIQSTCFPMFDRNPGKFCDIFKAKNEDFRKTRQRVYRSATHPSFIRVTVLP
jgi:uncharacterized protein